MSKGVKNEQPSTCGECWNWQGNGTYSVDAVEVGHRECFNGGTPESVNRSRDRCALASDPCINPGKSVCLPDDFIFIF